MKKIDSTRKIPLGTVVRLYKKGFGYCRAEILENSNYFIALKVASDFINAVTDRDILEAYIGFDDEHIFEFKSEVIGKIFREPWILFISHSEEITIFNERKCLTAKTSLPVNFFIIDTHVKKNFHSDNIEMLEGTVLELCDRDALLSTEADITPGVFIKGHLKGGKGIEILGKVVSALGNNLFNISFESAGDKERILILEYVMNIYRE
jgi:hypothetical protein